jgi:hypothetical protein
VLEVEMDPRAGVLMDLLEIGQDRVRKVLNEPGPYEVSGDGAIYTALRDLGGGRLFFAEASIADAGLVGGLVEPRRVRVHLALELAAELPAGWVDINSPMGVVLDRVARSFGFRVSGHPDRPFAHVYVGPMDGALRLDPEPADGRDVVNFAVLTGDGRGYSVAYAIDVAKYRRWFRGEGVG